MAYITLADLEARFGAGEIVQIADRDLDGVPDEPLITTAINDASNTIDAYLGARFVAPIEPVPELIKRIAADISRYYLSGSEALETSPAQQRYKDALKLLTDLRDGKTTIAGLVSRTSVIGGVDNIDGVSGSGSVQFSNGREGVFG